VLVGGGLAVYGAANSLFNVEGGHRAIVFNRLVGIKEEVRNAALAGCTCCIAWGLGTQADAPHTHASQQQRSDGGDQRAARKHRRRRQQHATSTVAAAAHARR
jgi:hypothetical protein